MYKTQNVVLSQNDEVMEQENFFFFLLKSLFLMTIENLIL